MRNARVEKNTLNKMKNSNADSTTEKTESVTWKLSSQQITKKKEWKRVKKIYGTYGGFPGGTSGREPPTNAGDARDVGLIPGLERFHREGHDNPLQYSCLENPKDRGALKAIYSPWGCKEWDTNEVTQHTHGTQWKKKIQYFFSRRRERERDRKDIYSNNGWRLSKPGKRNKHPDP